MAYAAITLATLQQRLAERYESVPYWGLEESRLALNEVLRVWNAFTGYWKRQISISTVADERFVTVPGTMHYPVHVEFGGVLMDQCSIYDLDMGQPGWEGETTTSGGTVPTSPTRWAPLGTSLMAIWPADAAGGNTLTVDGVRATPTLSIPTDTVDIGEEEFSVLLGEALHRLSFKAGGAILEGTKMFHQQFLAAAADRNAMLLASAEYRHYAGLDLNHYSVPTRPQA